MIVVRSIFFLFLGVMGLGLLGPISLIGTAGPGVAATLTTSTVPVAPVPVATPAVAPLEVKTAQATDTRQGGPRALGVVPSAVEVPSLQCLSAADARATLEERKLRLGKVHQRPSSACPNGGVIAQSPPQGTSVRPGTAIEVVITVVTGATPGSPAAQGSPAGQGSASTPDIVGLTPARAQGLLRREGLDIGSITRESAAAPLGTIVTQTPKAGSPVNAGGRVNVVVAAEVRVPDLRRLSRADALSKLGESSLALGRVSEESSSQPGGTVIKQWPLPGVPAAADDKVDITVAIGQSVPDLATLTLNEAKNKLRDAGLQPGRVDSRVSDQRRGTIIDQRPSANDAVRPGTAVNVVLAAAPIIPNLAGRTVDQARRLLSTQLLKVGSISTKVSTKPQGTVIEQQPRANAEASPGAKVNLLLAGGLEVPRLIGFTLDEAGAELAKRLMRINNITRRPSPDGDGKIIEQSPTPGSPASFGVGVDVTIAEAPTVPDLRGMTQDAVTARLGEHRLTLAEVGFQLIPGATGETVVGQTPPPGSDISNGTEVSIVLGVAGAPADRSDLVAVPVLPNLTLGQADQSLKRAGLLLQVVGTADDSRPHRVTGQEPTAGRFISIGTPVLVTVEPIDEVIVPDLAGLDQDLVNRELSDSFLTTGENTWKLSGEPQGTVIDQNPLPGAKVAFGEAIDVVLSATALIPDLTGLTPEEASPILGSETLTLGGIEEVFSLRWPGTIVDQLPGPGSPAGLDSVVRVKVVGMVGSMTAGGSILLALAGIVWFRARQGGQANPTVAMPPPVYGVSKPSTPRPAFSRTAKAARPAAATDLSQPDFVVNVDSGTQVIQTDASTLVKPAIRLRGRTDPGEQILAIEPS